jgi:hypothetical protein
MVAGISLLSNIVIFFLPGSRSGLNVTNDHFWWVTPVYSKYWSQGNSFCCMIKLRHIAMYILMYVNNLMRVYWAEIHFSCKQHCSLYI